MAPTDEKERLNTPPELLVNLGAFEGPMDLLLELIRKHEIDIFDIPIALITEEYLVFIEAAGELDLEIGGEWLEMAAWLILIKSRMLLPKEENADDEDGPDPREELVERLIEYQKYKLAASALDERPVLDRDVFTHPQRGHEFEGMVGPPPLKTASITDLMRALESVIKRSKEDGKWVYEVNSQKLTLRSVILHIATLMQQKPRRRFEELFEDVEMSRHRVITTFLALLEMTRLKMLKLFQSRLDGDEFWVERSVVDIIEVSQELELEKQDPGFE